MYLYTDELYKNILKWDSWNATEFSLYIAVKIFILQVMNTKGIAVNK